MKNSLMNNTLRDMKNYMKYINLFLMVIGMGLGSLNTASAATAAGTYTLQKGAKNSTSLDPGNYVIAIKSTYLYAVPGFDGAGAKNIECKDYEITSYMTGSYYQRDEDCILDLDGTEGITEWTITENLGSYKFFDGTYYICGQSTTSNKLLASTSSATAAEWSITHTGTTYTGCVVRNDDDVTYEYCRGNGTKLSGYESSGQNLYFFKKTATLYDIHKEPDASGTASMDTKVGGVSVTKAAAGATVALSQTAKPNYRFDSWSVAKENLQAVTVTNNQFTMPAEDVWVYPLYTACGTDATVTAASSESVSQTSATIRCSSGISSKGDSWCAITEYGFVISAKATDATPTIGETGVTKHQIGTSYTTLSTAFSKALTGLTASTTYCVRAYAINGHGTAYSSAVHEFTTSAEIQYGNYVITCDDYHTVTYNKNTTDDITGSLPTDANTYASGETVYMSDGTIGRTGYTFEGWNTNPAATTAITEFVMGASNTTVYAIWSPIDYTLTMATSVGGGAGTTVSNAAITSPRTGAGAVDDQHYRDEITVTVVAPAHHTFTGWASSNGGSFANASSASTTFTMPAGNTTVTASFTEDTKYTVTWSDNGVTDSEQVYSGETTTFPALADGCDMYVAAGWVQDNSGTFVSETLTAPGTIYAVGATTPTVSGNVTYKAVYRHKYYTADDFVNGTTDGAGYYLYAEYSSNKHYKTTHNGSDAFNTSTTKSNAVPVYLIKTGDYYYIQDVNTGKYYYSYVSGSTYSLKADDTNSATDAYKWSIATSACETPGMGNYKITNKAHAENTTLRLNSSGNYIKQYKQTGDCPNSGYYDLNLEKAYYYKYSPDAACYDITVSTNGWERATWQTLDGSKKLQGTQLTVTPACGYHITSVTITNGTFTPTSGYTTHNPVTFTIVPSGNCTFTVNFNSTPSDDDKYTISFLDGATSLPQTKTDPIKACGSVTLPNGYNTASRDGGACTDWTFDGWTATNYTYGQMSEPSSIQAASSSQMVSSDQTWYAVYHKTFAAGAYFKLKYGDYYIEDINNSNQFTTTTTEADGLMFQLEDGYLYYIDKTTRAKKWVYYGGTDQRVVVDDHKPTSNSYKTTITANSGTYEVKSNGRWLEINGSQKVVFYNSTDAARRPTKPNASGFTAYYPKTDCAIEYVTITYDAGAGNSCSPASAEVESGSTITLPIEADITYDNTDWTFAGWSTASIPGYTPGSPAVLLAAGATYTATENITLRAVYSQTPPDGTFDNTKGGRYIIWAEDGGINYYATSNGQTKGKLSNTTTCSEASIFEFVETETAGEYKIHISGEAKYMGGEGCGGANTDFIYTTAASAPVWSVSETATDGVWAVASTCGNRGFVFQNSGSRHFGHFSFSGVNGTEYKHVYIGNCGEYYTTNPNKNLAVTGDVKVTSVSGRMVMASNPLVINASSIGASAEVTISSNSSNVYFSSARNVNIVKGDKPTTSLVINADASGDISDQNIYVHYMPTESTDGIEDVLVTISSPEKTAEKTIKVRHLPSTFAIAAKVGGSWYALTGNMSGSASTPKAIQIDVDESSWTAYAPDTCAYQLWPVKTTSTSGDRYQTQGEKVRFSAVNNATIVNAGLSANNSSPVGTGINNYAAITAISSDPAEAYEWKITASESGSTWKYTLQMDNTNNKRFLNISGGSTLNWGTFASSVTNEIYLLPMTTITPFEMKVVEWYPTKVLVYTTNTLSSPTIKVNNATIAGATCTSKGTNLYEIGNLNLVGNPAKSLSVSYTAAAVNYSCTKTIPVIISRGTLSLNSGSGLNEPFMTLTNNVYKNTDLVVRDGAVLTVNGTSDQNTFYDVTIYPTAKISVPESNYNSATNKLNVHSLTFFGGIDEIYDGSDYSVNKYGVPELSLKGQFGTKTLSTINYDMRVDLNQMYALALPYDVDLEDITYWDGTEMVPGTDLYISAYDGQARANRENKAWIYEEDFEDKLGAATLKAGVGYTISAELQSGFGNTYSIIRMPMTSNVANDETEAAKTVAVKAYVNTEGETVTDNHKGWNFVGNPYMATISGGDPDTKLIVGKLVPNTKVDPWDGSYMWDGTTYPYRYVTIPSDDGTENEQAKWADVTLKPFKNFFIQVGKPGLDDGETGDLSFALASRVDAPARYAMTQEQEVEFEIQLSNTTHTDHTGLLIAEVYSPAYEINADLEKMENPMSVYTLTSGYKLAYNALSPNDAKQPIPIGYIANEAGSYTFQLDERSDVNEVEHIWLTDYEQDRVTDLMDETYSFTTIVGRNETRFALTVELRSGEEIATDIGNSIDGIVNDGAVKFIWHDKMYILNQGVIYDSTGKRVVEINK